MLKVDTQIFNIKQLDDAMNVSSDHPFSLRLAGDLF